MGVAGGGKEGGRESEKIIQRGKVLSRVSRQRPWHLTAQNRAASEQSVTVTVVAWHGQPRRRDDIHAYWVYVTWPQRIDTGHNNSQRITHGLDSPVEERRWVAKIKTIPLPETKGGLRLGPKHKAARSGRWFGGDGSRWENYQIKQQVATRPWMASTCASM